MTFIFKIKQSEYYTFMPFILFIYINNFIILYLTLIYNTYIDVLIFIIFLVLVSLFVVCGERQTEKCDGFQSDNNEILKNTA